MKRGQKEIKEQQGMWDVLLPILAVIAVLPWIVRLAIYSCGYSIYDWYGTEDILTDFYCYYKGYFLDVIGVLSAIVLVFRLGLYKEKTKDMRIYIPIGVYAFFVILSTIFSINTDASLKGNFESFESVFVLLSYCILSLYAYQVMEYERDYRYVWYAVIGITVFFIIIGMFQVFHQDLMNFPWIQRLIMDKEEFALYGGEIEDTFIGNNVYLSLYNPNYAGIALNMLFAIIFVMFLTEQEKRKKIVEGSLCILVSILIWFTYSRASLLAMVLTLILSGVFLLKGKIKRRQITVGAGVFLILAIGLVSIDAAMDFKYISRWLDRDTREPLESMVTDEDGIHIVYDKEEYQLYLENETLLCSSDAIELPLIAAEGEDMLLPMEEGALAFFYGNEIYVYIAENTLVFIAEDDGYYYITANGKRTWMEPIEAADFHGLEYLGSARGYIWSRVVPLLKKYVIMGSGPDTFPEAFPQNDYAGKVVYSDRPDMIIEKAHNDYLTKWVQTGGISLVAIIVFYILFIKSGIACFGKKKQNQGFSQMSIGSRIGLGCYIACISYMFTGIFNDSTLQTSPWFWVFAGIALSSMIKKKV